MLKTEMIDKLNEQMNLELYSSLLYQQMSAWCSYHSFEGAAAFLRRHAQEEMTHMQRCLTTLPIPEACRALIPFLRPSLSTPHWMSCSARPMSMSSLLRKKLMNWLMPQ